MYFVPLLKLMKYRRIFYELAAPRTLPNWQHLWGSVRTILIASPMMNGPSVECFGYVIQKVVERVWCGRFPKH